MRSFYRVVKDCPPTDRDYVTAQDKLGDPPPGLPEEKRRSWDALSVFDSEEGARRQAEMYTHLGGHVARYDIPEGASITATPSGEEGHFDLRGDKAELKGYLSDFCVKIRQRKEQGAG